MTLGKKIAAGFCLTIFILVILSLYSIIQINGVAKQSARINTTGMPQVEAANEVLKQFVALRRQVVKYLGSGHSKDGAEAKALLPNVYAAMEVAETLASQQKLEDLAKNIETAHSGLDSYANALQDIENIFAGISISKQNMIEASGSLVGNVDKFLLKQQKELKNAINVGERKEILSENEKAISIATEIIRLRESVRVANFEAQAVNDVKIAAAVMDNFDKIQSNLDELKKLAVENEYLKDIETIKTATNRYKSEMATIVEQDKLLQEKIKEAIQLGVLVGEETEKTSTDGIQDTKDLTASANSSLHRLVIALIIGSIVAVAIAAFSAFYVIKIITTPINLVVEVVNKIAAGDLTVSCPYQSEDEMGVMSKALNGTVASLNEAIQTIASRSQAVASSSEELTAVTTQLASNATETSAQAHVVSAAAEQVGMNISTVATAIEEMSVTTREIASNSQEAAYASNDAVEAIGNLNQIISRLDLSSSDIGKVVSLITSIAEQTNLLALNATIEAARAGEAGKGFAVVANEVKELAKQTALATDEIAQKISCIQTDTKETVNTITHFGTIIQRVNEISSSIAAAVEEQSVTTNEIAQNMDEARKGSQSISENIVGVAEAAQSTAAQTTECEAASKELSNIAAELAEVVGLFKC